MITDIQSEQKMYSRKYWRTALLCSTALCLSSVTANSQEIIEDSVPGSGNGVVIVSGVEERSNQIIRNTTPSWGNAVFVNGPDAGLTGNNLLIEVQGTSTNSGDLSVGVRANGSVVDLTGGAINTTGARFNRGILGLNGATITTDATSISTIGDNSHGVHLQSGAAALIQGGWISTTGADSFGLYSQNIGASLTAQDVDIVTIGENGFGAFAYGGAELELIGGFISTSGVRGHGAVAGLNSSIELGGTTINTSGDRAWGLVADQAGTSITAHGVDIETSGFHAYGAYASAAGPDTANISLTGGAITTANTDGQFVRGPEARGYALFAEGNGAFIEARGTTIKSLGQRSYGAYAVDGATIGLHDLSVTTEGFMGYGIYASGIGSRIVAENVDITTVGQVGDAAWAYQGGQLELNGGIYHVQGERNPNVPGETANGLVAVGGAAGLNDGVIDARGVTVVTEGAGSMGLVAGSPIGADNTSGRISLFESSVTVRGADAVAGRVSYGGTLNVENSRLVSEQGVGLLLIDSASVSLDRTLLSASQETFVSNLESAGQAQQITINGASVATQNNGTLLQVNRTVDGGDGEIFLTLGIGSETSGDIIDEDADITAGGGTDVTLQQDATWSGVLRGVRNFFGFAGGEVNFEDEAQIAGNLNGNGTSYVFSDQGGQIGGDVTLDNGSQTTGGTIQNRVNVDGNVSVDDTSALGGNWNIAGDLTSAGTLAPGNSIGRVSVGGDLLLAPTSVYAVDIDATGNSDLVDVAGTATLAGSVTVTPLGGVLLDSPYTILTAGTRAGTFDGGVRFANDSAFLAPTLSYDPNTVFLTIQRNNVTFASVAQTPNQLAVAQAIDRLPLSNSLAGAVALGTAQGASVAFDQVSGEIHASAKSALTEDSRHIRNAVNDRIRAAFDNVAASPVPVLSYGPGDASLGHAPDHGPTGWGSVFGSWGSTDRTGNTAKLDRSTGGFVAGIDGMFGSWRVGALAGYSRSSFTVDGRSSSGSADNVHIGAYGGSQWGPIGLRTGVAYTWSDVRSQRTVAFPGFADNLSAQYGAGTFQAFGELGYAIETSGASFEPFINLAHVNLHTNGFVERGGAAALTTAASSTGTTFTTLGVRASANFNVGDTKATARGMIGWRHAFGNTAPHSLNAFAAGPAFTVTGAPIAKNTAVVELGLDFAVTPAATLGVSYDGQFGSGSHDHGGRIGLNVRF